jgi:hypothetical protein
MKMEQSVPERRHIKFRRREITQKKTYNKNKVCSNRLPPQQFDKIHQNNTELCLSSIQTQTVNTSKALNFFSSLFTN